MKRGRRRLIRAAAMLCAVALAALLISWLFLASLGVSIPLDGFRSPMEVAVSRALGREVKISGALVLTTTTPPTIVAHQVRIMSQPGQREVLRAVRVAIPLAPFALLRGKLPSKRLLIEEAKIELDGERLSADLPPQPTAQQPEWQEIVVRPLLLSYRGDREHAYEIRFDQVSIRNQPGQAFELAIEGRIQEQPYNINVKSGRREGPLTAGASWPLQGKLRYAEMGLLLDGRLQISRQGLVLTSALLIDWPAAHSRFAAQLRQVALTGALSLDTKGDRPLVRGELRLAEFDALLRFGAGLDSGPLTGDAPFTDLRPAAVSLATVPVAFDLAGASFRGRLHLLERAGKLLPELTLSATDVNAGALLARLAGREDIRGKVERLGFQASLQTQDEDSLLNRVALALRAVGSRLSYGSASGKRAIDVTVDELELSLPAGDEMALQARGTLLEEPFSAQFTAGGLEALLLDKSWPVTLSVRGSGAVLDVDGSVASAQSDTATRLQLGLYGERLGDLSIWLGVSPCAITPYLLQGQLVLEREIGRLQFVTLQTDQSRLSAELDWSGYIQGDRLLAMLRFETLNTADLEALIPLVTHSAEKGLASRVAIDLPVLAQQVEITNADIDVAIEHLPLKPLDITDVSLLARIREGRLQRSAFHAHLGGARLRGYLDPTTDGTTVVFENGNDETAASGRLSKLFSDALRWAGSSAMVPLRWFIEKKLFAADPAECQLPAAVADKH